MGQPAHHFSGLVTKMQGNTAQDTSVAYVVERERMSKNELAFSKSEIYDQGCY